MRRNPDYQIDQTPKSPGQIRLSQNPTATQSAQAIGFRQTCRHYKLIAQMKSGARRVFKHRLEINFINQNPRARATRNLADLVQVGLVDEGVAWIVQIGYHN